MAKAVKKKAETSAKADSVEFFEAVRLLEREKGIPAEYLLEKIRAAIVIAVRRDYGGKDNITVTMDPATGVFAVSLDKRVVEEILDPDEEMLLEQAVNYKKSAMVGDLVQIPLETKQFGRIAAQTAKHVIRQGIREAERGQQLQEMQRRNQELITGVVTRVDARTGAVTLEIGRNEAMLPKSEQLPEEVIREGDRLQVYVTDVRESEKGPRLILSRTHSGLVRRLLEKNVPEIFSGTVEIKAIAREAGSRTKLAVQAHEENVDAVGACIGTRGARIADVVDALGGEKIDVVEYSDQPEAFISAALAPAKVTAVEVDPEGAKSCRVTVPDAQLSLAIGNKGQNARLAAKLTGWKIDIRPESEVSASPAAEESAEG